MKKTYDPGLRVPARAILLAALCLVSCSDKQEETPPAPPVKLNNQIQYDGREPVAVRSAIYEMDADDGYTFYLSPTSGISDMAGMQVANDYLRIAVHEPIGTVNPATEAFEVSYSDILLTERTMDEAEKLELSVNLTKETSHLDLTLETVLRTGKTLRVRYNGACPEAAPQQLENQYELDKRISAIARAVVWHRPLEGTTTYAFYTQSGIEAPSDATPADLEVIVADGTETAHIVLSDADPAKVSVRCGGFLSGDGTTGTLSMTLNESGTELTVALDARNGVSRLRAAYDGPVSTGYASSDRIRITEDGTSEEASLTGVFCYKESIMNYFAFGTADSDAPAGLMQGRYAIELGLSNLQIGTTIDLATEASKCTLALHDYEQYTTRDIGKSSGRGATGTITTGGTAERLYLRLAVAFPDGPTVECEWYGQVTPVGQAYELAPVKPFVPHMKIVSPDDEVLTEQKLSNMEVRLEKGYRLRGGDPKYGGDTFDAYFFYFRHENSTEPIETPYEYPRLMLPASFLNSTELDLSEEQTGLHWNFRFINQNFQYTEYTERYTMYGSASGYCPDEVTATVVHNADKTWNVSFRMKDYGSYSSWAPDRKEGTQNTITIEWAGAATPYSGSNKNDLTDADY